LFLQRIGFCGEAILLEDAMAIMIERQGTPVLFQHLLHQQKVACRIFFLAEDRRCPFAGGIIDGCNQTQPGASIPKPGMPTAIDLHQHPFLRVALPPSPMHPPFVWPGRSQSRLLHDPSH
jgi:hypothetical protein